MEYTKYDMNAYNLHIIKTDKFKTVTVGVAFLRKMVKEEITIRNLLKEMMLNATNNYPSEKELIIETENLYDLKLLAQTYRIGNDSILTFKTRFLHEDYTEKGMNLESIKFLLDIIFNPKLDIELDKCKEKIRKSIISLSDNKIKYALNKLLETAGDMPYAYNSYGYIEDLDKVTYDDISKYYDSVIRNDIVDVYVVGNVNPDEIKNIFKEYFKLKTYHKSEVEIITKELPIRSKVMEYREKLKVNQTQLDILCSLHGLTDRERKCVLGVYGEMLGGSANSILFDAVREKNSYAYYVNAIVKSYDNTLAIYSGIEKGNEENVYKIIKRELKKISHGKIDDSKFESAKKTIISAIKTSVDTPMGIINNYYAMRLVNSLDVEGRIKNIESVTKDEIIRVSKKIKIYSTYILEDLDEEDNDKDN